LAGRAKYQLRITAARLARRRLDSIAELAHPHQFVARDFERLLTAAGFEIVTINRRRFEAFRRIWTHPYRMLIVALKPQPHHRAA